MQIFLYLMYGITFVVAVMLILVILIQRSKSGGGLGGLATTSSGVEEAFGSDAGNVLVKVTWFLGAVFLTSTITIGILQGFIAQHEDRDMGDEGYMSSSDTGKKDDSAAIDGSTAGDEDKAAADEKDEKVEDKADDAKAGGETEKAGADKDAEDKSTEPAAK